MFYMPTQSMLAAINAGPTACSYSGGNNRVAFARGFDGHDLPSRMRNNAYFDAGKRAWGLVEPIAEQRRREFGR